VSIVRLKRSHLAVINIVMSLNHCYARAYSFHNVHNSSESRSGYGNATYSAILSPNTPIKGPGPCSAPVPEGFELKKLTLTLPQESAVFFQSCRSLGTYPIYSFPTRWRAARLVTTK